MGASVKRQNARSGKAVRVQHGTLPVKDMILEALAGVGGVEYLVNQAKENPRAFLTLVAKVVPPQVTERNDEPVVQVVRWATSDEEATPDPSRS